MICDLNVVIYQEPWIGFGIVKIWDIKVKQQRSMRFNMIDVVREPLLRGVVQFATTVNVQQYVTIFNRRQFTAN